MPSLPLRSNTTAAKPAQSSAMPSSKPLNLRLVGLASVSSLLLLWWAVTQAGLIAPLFLPAPDAVLRRLLRILSEGYMNTSLWQHLGASLQRIGLALTAALVTAVPLGIAMGRIALIRGIFDPLIEFYRPIPPLAYLPLIVIWCGIGELSKVLLIYLAIFAPLAIATAAAVRRVDPSQLRAAQALGATDWQLVRWVVLPSALPQILTGLRIGLGVGWSTLVAAELIAATSGLGFMVQSAAQFLVTEVVILGIFLIALIACALELGLRALQRRLAPWAEAGH